MKRNFSPTMLARTISLLTLLWLAGAAAQGQTFTTLHNTFGTGADGQNPYAGLFMDSSGNLYGTTNFGGANGYGTVFELVNSGGGTYSYEVLYSFIGTNGDGATPWGGVVMVSGNLYGTTASGGGLSELGTVFELTPAGGSPCPAGTNAGNGWCEEVLHTFAGYPSDGAWPYAGLVMDSSGNLYGTTSKGGSTNNNGAPNGNGTVFELVNSGGSYSESLLYSFESSPDGVGPVASLVVDSSGDLYGTTYYGGTSSNGTVFELVKSGGIYSESLLYSFGSSPDGALPSAGLVMDSSGDLYGTTYGGGASGDGTVFELVCSSGTSPCSGTYTEKLLYSFAGNPDGAEPYGGVVMNPSSGTLYGTTYAGGANGDGTVFQLDKSGTELVLYSFTGSTDGKYPYAGLLDSSGNLYGTTTLAGASGDGTVFELSPACPSSPNYAPDFSQNEDCLALNGLNSNIPPNTGYPSFQSPIAPTGAAGGGNSTLPSNVSKVLRLTPNQTFWAASAWYTTPQSLSSSFSTTFSFELGGANTDYGNADGIAFVIQNSSLTALGPGGCGVGFGDDPALGICAPTIGGIPDSLAVEFKTYNDGYQLYDNGANYPNTANSVTILSNSSGANCIDASCVLAVNNNPQYMGSDGLTPIILANGNIHTAIVTYSLQSTSSSQTNCGGGTEEATPCLDVILDGVDQFPAGVSVNLSTYLGSSTAWFGFTAGTGGGDDNQDILSWGPSQTGTLTPTQPVTANTSGGYTNGGQTLTVTDTVSTESPQTVTITPITSTDGGACNTLVQNSLGSNAQCLQLLNGYAPGVDGYLFFEVTCPGYPVTSPACGGAANPTFFANLAEYNYFSTTTQSSEENPGLTVSNGMLLYNGGNPYVFFGKFDGGLDPNHPCKYNPNNLPTVYNQTVSMVFSDGQPSQKPTTGSGSGGGSCWFPGYGANDETPTAVINSAPSSPVTQGTTQYANFTCTAVNEGSSSLSGPYLTVNSCNLNDTWSSGSASYAGTSGLGTASSTNTVQVDTSNLGLHTLVANETDSATNIVSSVSVPYTVVPPTVQVTVGTNPSGLSVIVNGTTYTAPTTVTVYVGSTLTLNTTSPQTPVAGTEYTFASWSQGGVQSQSITVPSTAATYTATFNTLYQLTTAVSPSGAGTVTPASGNYYAAGTSVSLTATPSAGYIFSSWTGSPVSVSGSASTTVTMGAAPETVTANFVSALTVVPTSINFGNVYLGTAAIPQNITLTNIGTMAITINTPFVTLLKGQSSAFGAVNLCPSSLAPGKQCEMVASFLAGPYYQQQSAIFNVMYKVGASSFSQQVTLIATSIDPMASLSPSSLNFGTITHGTTSTLSVTLSNPGATPLTIYSITITPTNQSAFTQTNNCTSPLAAAGGKCTIAVEFAPTTTGTFSASLTVSDNALGSPQNVPLSGKGK